MWSNYKGTSFDAFVLIFMRGDPIFWRRILLVGNGKT